MNAVFFLIDISLLFLSGWLLATLLIGNSLAALRLSLALPLAALCNGFLILLLTLFHLALTPVTIWGSTLILALALWILLRIIHPESIRIPATTYPDFSKQEHVAITIISAIVLSVAFLYASFHALIVPTLQWDSLTNWNMRSEISFVDHAVAFDSDETRGMAKPQYPILFHALEITANQGQSAWNDHLANAVMLLLSLSSAFALFILVKLLRGTTLALLCLTMLVSVPLLSFHLAQGYADLPLAQFLLLALASLIIGLESSEPRWLLLCSVFVAASAWTKLEGLFVGLLPFLLLLGIFFRRRTFPLSAIMRSALVVILLTLPFPFFAVSRGLLLTPHSSDTALGWSSIGFSSVLPALFSSGALGVSIAALCAACIIVFLNSDRCHTLLEQNICTTICWGGCAFFEYIVLYLFTPNVQFLLNQQSFFRQMLVPVTLMGLSFILLLSISQSKEHPTRE